MATIKQKRSIIKPIIITGIAVVVLLAGSLVYVYGLGGNLFGWKASPSINQSDNNNPGANDPETDTPSEHLPDKDKPSQTPVKQGGKDEPENTSVEQPNVTRSSVSGTTLKVVATFEQTSSGTCNFTLTSPGTEPVSYESAIVVGPSYYYCSLSADVADLANSKTWSLTVTNKTSAGSRSSQAVEVVIP